MVNQILHYFQSMVGRKITDSPSATSNWLGGTLLAIHDDGMEWAFEVRPEMTNPAGVLHGGIAVTMLDDIVGISVMALQGAYHASVNLTADFLAPARAGDRLIARSRLVRRGKRLVNAEAMLQNAQGEWVARITTNVIAAPAQEIRSSGSA
jgi:uncharacterized protein (TIGR00369 family)